MHSLFHLLFVVSFLAFVTVMWRPRLAGRFISNPTRKRIMLPMIPLLLVTVALSDITKPKSPVSYGNEVSDVADGGRPQGNALTVEFDRLVDTIRLAQRYQRTNEPNCRVVADHGNDDLHDRNVMSLNIENAAAVLHNDTEMVKSACKLY
ncbi:hypothetical protein AWB71_05297 [Caballeronia peredens]|nr:hypothetical protein AWB71_05297 [Caballeronia peredens]